MNNTHSNAACIEGMREEEGKRAKHYIVFIHQQNFLKTAGYIKFISDKAMLLLCMKSTLSRFYFTFPRIIHM